MLKRLLIVFTLLFSVSVLAQQGTTSPYSFFGIGSLKFKGTVENRSMGGLGVYSDSIHLNIQNPAAVSELKLVNFSIAGSHKFNTLSTEQETQRVTTTTLDYLAIGIPMGKFGTGEDVSNSVAFLSSDQASYITGETIHVNGGMYMS